jgi:hypothetical protein
MYASYYNLNCPVPSTALALELHSRAKTLPCLQERPWWCLSTQGFALAAKLLAILSMKDSKFEDSQELMEDAITRLALGDLECRTRAMMLSNILCEWLEERGDVARARAWGAFRLRLESDMNGKTS